MKRVALFAGLVPTVWMAACSQAPQDVQCRADADCDPGQYCQTESNMCRCRTDDACGEGMYCNPFGACQDRPPCLSNDDCLALNGPGFICNTLDRSGGACIAADACGANVHCQFNQRCDRTSGQCVNACDETGDCQLGLVCVKGADGRGTCQAGSAACSLCPTRPDAPDSAFCDDGEVCSLDGNCVAANHKADLCRACDENTRCATGMICLIDPEMTSGEYCANGCKTNSDCPNGFNSCNSLSLVMPGAECTNTGTCANGGRCLQEPETNRAFCECVSASDCSLCQEWIGFGLTMCPDGSSCTTAADCIKCVSGACMGTDLPCTTNQDCVIECSAEPAGSGDTIGMCQTVAKACGKDSGLLCSDVQNGAAVCQGL